MKKVLGNLLTQCQSCTDKDQPTSVKHGVLKRLDPSEANGEPDSVDKFTHTAPASIIRDVGPKYHGYRRSSYLADSDLITNRVLDVQAGKAIIRA